MMTKSPTNEENSAARPTSEELTPDAAAANPAADQGGMSPEMVEDIAIEAALNQLKDQLAESNDRVLRAQAELENYRKRARREMEDERRYAASNLIVDILNVGDNLQRAIASAENSAGSSALLEGVKMVAIQLHTYLENHHCRQIETVGKSFDPNRHEAIAQEASSEHGSGIVLREVRSGYLLHDRVVRPAQVIVSSGPPTAKE